VTSAELCETLYFSRKERKGGAKDAKGTSIANNKL